MITTVFIDRDGTVGGNGHFKMIEDFKPYAGFGEVIRKLKESKIAVYCLTNQTHINSGDMDYEDLKKSMVKLGFDDVFVCPHTEFENCECRKPKRGLIEQAHKKYNFSNESAIIIGDSYKSDMRLAMKESILGIHVATGRKEVRNDYHLDNINIIETKDIVSACTWIIKNNC
ncbi:HAD-IIIA family hydrolase [Liquorilactobacillus hordei DSM 19519]|nr:HAD-IIIA family hydrolase [Liquorilactobacillus hordei]QYH53145.1 HAD-IIIA family hydrolase [Liquorilactobacillus hordei DSM 19519]